GDQVAFAGRERADSPWRIWCVSRFEAHARNVSPLRCRTCDEAAGNDADPIWWGDTLLYVSTRRAPADSGSTAALYDGTPVTQLWALFPDGRGVQLTHEPNGVLDPAADRPRGRVVFARWWFNPWRPDSAGGVTSGGRGMSDSVNLWQAVTARLARGVDDALRLEDLRLAAGGTLPRRSGMAVQPAPAPGGGLYAVAAHNTGLAPRPGALAIQRYAPPPSAG